MKGTNYMDIEFVNDWLNKLKEYWFNKDIDKAVALFNKTTFYQETPFMKPYTTIEEINQIYYEKVCMFINGPFYGKCLECPRFYTVF